jgi:hypothetical protein
MKNLKELSKTELVTIEGGCDTCLEIGRWIRAIFF